MKAYCITIYGNEISEKGYENLVESSRNVGNDFEIEKFPATHGQYSDIVLKGKGLKWTYPWEGQRQDIASGLTLTAYETKTKENRIGCFLSHYNCWEDCLAYEEPILVLEHDAFFTKKLDYDYILESKYDIIGINDPRGCTRKSKIYYDIIQERKQDIQPVPRIDTWNIPQGLAGNSAYIIKPNGAQNMEYMSKAHGAWPNDALMCHQLVANLGVTKQHYTTVQRLPSTTTSI